MSDELIDREWHRSYLEYVEQEYVEQEYAALRERVAVLEKALTKIYNYRSDEPDWNMIMAIAHDAIDPREAVMSALKESEVKGE